MLWRTVRAAEEPREPVEAAVRRLEARWEDVTRRVAVGRESVTASNTVVQFGAELDSLMSTISVYDKWASPGETTHVAKDFVKLSQHLEQCRVSCPSSFCNIPYFNLLDFFTSFLCNKSLN